MGFFLIKVLTCLGFSQVWINWIKECISTVSYFVVVNGSPRGHFTPLRGVRQGDPLSPFPFIIGSEALSRLISREENLGNINGISISRRGPSLTHLLFVDNINLFG